MKKCLVGFLGFLSVGFSAIAFADGPQLVPAPVEKVFVPQGFDDNDNVEVIMHGHFPDSCYKTGPATVTEDIEAKQIKITVSSYRYSDTNCMKMIVPFIQSVKLGTLPTAQYKVIVSAKNRLEPSDLSVGVRNAETPDDYLYAPVEDAYIDVDDARTEHYLVLMGSYPHTFVGCVMLDEVRTNLTDDGIFVVQPIMKFYETSEECKARGWKPRFNYREKISSALTAGDKLLHVRVLNGNSFNKLEVVEK